MARAEQATGAPVLSIVVATTHPWPEMERTLDSLWGQVMALGAELLLLDGHGEGLPPDLPARYPGAIRLTRPGASVFALRALGLRAARGEIIAMTEDHCVVPPDWCRRLLDAHRRYPHAAAVGGAVDNGATARLIDWANYFVAHSPTMAPIRGGEAEMISAQLSEFAVTGTNWARLSAWGQARLLGGVLARPEQARPLQPTTWASARSSMVAVWRPPLLAGVISQLPRALTAAKAVPPSSGGLASGDEGALVAAIAEMPGCPSPSGSVRRQS